MTAHAGVIPVGDVDRAVRRHADIGRAEPLVLVVTGKEVRDRGLVTGACGMCRVGAHDPRAGVAMDHLVAKWFGEKFSLVNENPGGRTGAGVQQIGHNTRIILVPFVKNLLLLARAFGLCRAPGGRPGRATHFIRVTEVAVFHHVIDANAHVAVVVVVRLP